MCRRNESAKAAKLAKQPSFVFAGFARFAFNVIMNSRVPPPFGLLETGPAPGAAELAAVLLHGRGGTAQQMIELAKRLDIDRARWLAPAAEGRKLVSE
jgi:hypothetical protein